MKYRIRHITEYKYNDIVSTCHNRLCLKPISQVGHNCISSQIEIFPRPDEITYETDFFGNNIVFFSLYQEHEKLEIHSTSTVDIENRNMADLAYVSVFRWKDARTFLFDNPSVSADVIQFTLPSLYIPYSEIIKNFAADCFLEDGTLWAGCQALMQKIYSYLEFKPGFTTINTPVETVLKSRKGVCQDFSHLMITCLRNLGLPARYVSGYIETAPPPGKPKLVGSDASHAWVSVFFPDVGWIDFDPTNCLIPSYKHITVAYGRDYFDVAPMKGIVFSSGKQDITVKVDVDRLD